MCGIVTVFNYLNKQPVCQDEVIKIRDRMRSRGPDAEGYWQHAEGIVAMGHRRLSILDLSDNGLQPMQSADGRFTVVLNGEIYNYRELQSQLKNKGYHFKSHSDTEVLLHLYAEYGAAMLPKLRGMFAFALWDEKQQGLLIARDPFGIKPLYIADDGQSIRVASQVQALLAGGEVDHRLDASSQVGFFMWGHVPEPNTWYQSIKAFPAGTSLWIDRQGKKQYQEYFNTAAELQDAENETEHTTEMDLRHALLDTVKHHFVSDVPVGLFLSAGMDSSLLLGLTHELGMSNLKTVTLGFKAFRGTKNDETILAEQLATQYKTDHQTVWLGEEDFLEAKNPMLAAMDQPTIDGVNTYFVSKVAKQLGLKVALSGLGGDELFGGYPSFQQIPKIVKYFALARYFPRLRRLSRSMLQPLVGRFSSSKYASLMEYGYRYAGAYLLRRGLHLPWELSEHLPAEVIREAEQSVLNEMEQNLQPLSSSFNKVRLLETQYYMRNQLLRDTDWSSMAHSLEVRVPLVDKVLFDVVRRLPPGKISKQFACGVLQQPLLPDILNKPKTGFYVPVRYFKETGFRSWAQTVNNRFAPEMVSEGI